jgi:hypothetical protein
MKPRKPGSKPERRFDDSKGHKAFKPVRTRTFHRVEDQNPTEGFDRTAPGGAAGKPKRSFDRKPGTTFQRKPGAFGGRDTRPPPRRPAAAAEIPRPAPPRAAAGDPGAVELVVTVPAGLMRQLEAHAAELGVESQPLVRVWLADKLRA